ncbi:IclR family transcriptional regulator [Desulfopila aestuarii]|uniref:Transcriptional regulator, IclR family n=1 Tax=Desulfopila aestuarii DSM 18488 TaxID=1121416 RepID=A0A1M7XY32_9BACT|nr:IclR family transcriptional regulator [Desulfopila aestuarii]SHO43859.1 transcriptional regulator, IclR family [Desulfopila aestuarii DSM 18488]
MSKQLVITGSSVEKALNILLAFAPHNTEMGTTEISMKLGMHKSTTSRLISILVATNFLQQNRQTRKYSLGRSAYRIGHAATRSTDTRLLAVAQPYLIELSQKTGESIALELVSGLNVILALHVEGPSHLRFNFQQGELVPINVAAGAKVILAYSDAAFVESCLQREFEKFNDKTIVSKDEYRKLLAKIRSEGIAYDRGERYPDIHAMAVPIRNPEGQPTAAVIMAGPASRLTDSFLRSVIADLQETAEKITKQLYL